MNQKESYKASQAINFLEQSDDAQQELSPEQEKIAAQLFAAMIDNMALERYGQDVLAQNPEKRISDLYRVPHDDGSYLSISVGADVTEAAAETFGSRPAYELGMQEIDANGDGNRWYQYEITRGDSRVIRKDLGDIKKKRNDYMVLNRNVDPSALLAYIEEPVSRQVVSPAEVDKLAALLSHATPRER